MKIHFIPALIAIAISALISYGLFVFHGGEGKELLTIGGFLFLSATLGTSLSISYEDSRTTTNTRVASGVFFGLALISNVVFAFFAFSGASYIITHGLFFLLFVLVVYSIHKAS